MLPNKIVFVSVKNFSIKVGTTFWPSAFGNGPYRTGPYWSSTKAPFSDYAYFVFMDNGHFSSDDKDDFFHPARCVRDQ
jgi:hypothetical protein